MDIGSWALTTSPLVHPLEDTYMPLDGVLSLIDMTTSLWNTLIRMQRSPCPNDVSAMSGT